MDVPMAAQLRDAGALVVRIVLVGYSSGASLAYAAIAAAPPETFAGAISLGFCPDIEIRVEPCRTRGLVPTKKAKGVGYDLEIGARGEPTSFVSWRIEPTGAAACTLAITVYPHVVQRVPVALRWLPHLAYVRPMLRSYLSSVVRGFEWYVTRGKPVPRNQFGSHRWFSER